MNMSTFTRVVFFFHCKEPGLLIDVISTYDTLHTVACNKHIIDMISTYDARHNVVCNRLLIDIISTYDKAIARKFGLVRPGSGCGLVL